MKKILSLLLAFTLIFTIFGCSQKTNTDSPVKSLKVGLITDLGGINDHDFNQLSYQGLTELHNEKPNIQIAYLESKSFSDYGLNIETYVNAGFDLIVVVGATFIETLMDAAPNYPNQKFAIVGTALPKSYDNVACLTFANEESAYLCGVAAAMKTKTNTIGFVQGMVTETLNRFGVGYIEGAKSINKDIKVLLYNSNNFADISGGNVATTNMIKNNADVLYHCAGATGIGVINACAENNITALGSNMDQSDIAPDHVMLSSIQNSGKAVKEFVLDMAKNDFKSGITESNIKNGNLDIVYNEKLVPNKIKEKLETLKKDIADGKIKISKTAEECPDFTLN